MNKSDIKKYKIEMANRTFEAIEAVKRMIALAESFKPLNKEDAEEVKLIRMGCAKMFNQEVEKVM